MYIRKEIKRRFVIKDIDQTIFFIRLIPFLDFNVNEFPITPILLRNGRFLIKIFEVPVSISSLAPGHFVFVMTNGCSDSIVV